MRPNFQGHYTMSIKCYFFHIKMNFSLYYNLFNSLNIKVFNVQITLKPIGDIILLEILRNEIMPDLA